MAIYHLPYGNSEQIFDLSDTFQADWIEPSYIPAAADPLAVIREALRHPVDGKPLASYAGARTIAIAINDKTRPVPHEHLLPPLLDELHGMGIPDTAIRFYIATGTHLPMMPEEFNRVLPESFLGRYQVVSHNCDDRDNLVYLGATTRGTPVWVNRAYMAAEVKIVVGDIEPHHFAGFSGGYKTAAIGLAGRETITSNHKMLVDPEAKIASVDKNPLRQDIDEIGDAIGVHLALNAILNSEKKIVRAVSGSPRGVMHAGIPLSREVCQVRVPSELRYDVIVASAGGAPKDINFYQSQKALTHAALLVRENGAIILAAECPEGSGSQSYEAYIDGLSTPEDVFAKFNRTGFQVGPHKAFQVARILTQARVILVSSMSPELVRKLQMLPADNLNQAFAMATHHLSPTPERALRIAILPRATNTIPISG